MPLCLKKIEAAITKMDHTYDANFGEWIQNENNCKIVGTYIRKYIGHYKDSDFITVVKWVVKDWTLKGIILFAKKLIIDDLFETEPRSKSNGIKINPLNSAHKNACSGSRAVSSAHPNKLSDLSSNSTYQSKVKILSGLIYTWNPIFISEFLLAATTEFSLEEKCEFYFRILDVFDAKKLSEILSQMENKTDLTTKDAMIERFRQNIYKDTEDKWKRTNSLTDAFNLI